MATKKDPAVLPAAEREAARLRGIAEAADAQLPALLTTERRQAELAALLGQLTDATSRGDDAEAARLRGDIERLRAQGSRPVE